jgi:hypothetical protein
MSSKAAGSIRFLALALLASACQDGAAPVAPSESDQASLELQAAVTQAGLEAELSGDADRAEVLRHGARALRWGIRPTEIEVKIQNETFTYLAIVVGRVHQRGDQRVLVRSLVAWKGRPLAALLNVTSASDHALFGHPGNGNGGPDGARGHWKNFAAHEVWVATAGTADLELLGTGDACPMQPPAIGLRCVMARWDVRVNGNFRLVGDDGPGGSPVEIHTNPDGVVGVVLKPAE